jgi:hypothetical protein
MYRSISAGVAMLAVAALLPSQSFACACGCGIFDVGTSSMLPTGTGGMAWLEYDFMNQDKNWHGTSSALGADNSDKDIKTSFYTAGVQYMFDRTWGVEAQVPYWDRHFTTTDDSSNAVAFNHSALGDIRVQGIYSGFSPDMSTGITFGFKLPTGDYTYSNFDRDTSIGSGSTDLLLGAYHMEKLAGQFNWFVNALYDQPFLTRDQYRPGAEIDAAIGTYYNGWTIGSVKIAPLTEVLNSYRLNDRGLAANPENSGYERILLAPGVEVSAGGWRVYGDVEVPVYQHFKGDQLVANELFKINISHSF